MHVGDYEVPSALQNVALRKHLFPLWVAHYTGETINARHQAEAFQYVKIHKACHNVACYLNISVCPSGSQFAHSEPGISLAQTMAIAAGKIHFKQHALKHFSVLLARRSRVWVG